LTSSGPLQWRRRSARSAHRFAPIGAHVVAEGHARQFVSHAPPPGRAARVVEPLARPEARGDRKAVDEVALALAQQLVVDGQHERVVAGCARTVGQLTREAAVPVDEDLHPAQPRVLRAQRLRQRFERAHRAVRQAVGRAVLGCGPRRGDLALGPEEARQARGADQHGAGQALAKERDRQVAHGGTFERARQDGPVVEG
jgi:hypothetical protein